MHNRMGELALLSLAGVLALGMVALFWAIGIGSSGAQDGTMHNCPPAGRWSIAVWDGPSDMAAGDALATCGAGAVDAAYSLDPQSGVWSRWFAGRPEVSDLATLNNLRGVLALGGAQGPATPTPSPTPTATLQEWAQAGTTYKGEISSGADMSFSVSADGERVASFFFSVVPGDTCILSAIFSPQDWEGALIINNSFSYQSATFSFAGHFLPGRAEGTLSFSEPEMNCESGELAWVALA
jgi:hypothetical protein